MPSTRTGNFPIGFRRARTAWQQDLPALLRFAREADFAFIDLGPVDADVVKEVRAAGVNVGTVDLKDWPALLSTDPAGRAAAVEINTAHLRSLASVGVTKFLTVLMPEDPTLP